MVGLKGKWVGSEGKRAEGTWAKPKAQQWWGLSRIKGDKGGLRWIKCQIEGIKGGNEPEAQGKRAEGMRAEPKAQKRTGLNRIKED